MTRRDHNDLAERVREELRQRHDGDADRAVIVALSELVYELRARVEALESATGGPR